MGLSLVGESALSIHILANTLDVSDYIQDSDAGDIGLAFNRCCRLAEDINSKCNVIKLNRGTYTMSTPVSLPMVTTANLPRTIDFDLRGAVINASGIVGFQRLPTSNVNANNVIEKLVPRIFGCEVQNATVGFDIGGTYGLYLEGCKATSCGTGYRVSFGLNAELYDCYATACSNYGFLVQTGDGMWSGGGVANSASNVTTLRKCRSWSNQYECIQYAVLGCDSVHLYNCISEGNACKYEVYFDAQGSTVVKQFYVEKHHCECTNPDVLLRLILRDQVCVIDGIDRGAIQARLIDMTGSATSRIELKNWHYLQGYARTAWVAGSFAAGTRRQHSGKQYTAIASVTAADTPGVSANWRDDGWSGAFISDSVELGGQIHGYITDYATLFDSAAWRCNGVNTLPKQLVNHYYDSNGYIVRCADGITLNPYREMILDSDVDSVYAVGTNLKVNGTNLTVP